MRITVVTPLYRVHNVERLYENISTVFEGRDWQWMIVLDKTSPEAASIERFMDREDRVINCRYDGGDRWKSSIARNMALDVEDGWIVNLDDDCLLHDNAGKILRMISPDTYVVSWQTIDGDGGIVNYPGSGKLASADANAFAYQRKVMDAGTWDIREDADMYYFNKLRGLFPIAYFAVPGAWWNINK
jgi:hypothetical protein